MAYDRAADPAYHDGPAWEPGQDLVRSPFETEISTRGGDVLAEIYTLAPIDQDVLKSWIDSPLDYGQLETEFAAVSTDTGVTIYDDSNRQPVWDIVVRNAQGEKILSL